MILPEPGNDPFLIKLPDAGAQYWQMRADTFTGRIEPADWRIGADQTVRLEGRTLLLLSGETA